MIGKRKYGEGEQKGGNVCVIEGCSKRSKGRRAFGTCGSRKCLAAAQRILLRNEDVDPDEDGRDPAKGMKIKVDGKGSTKTVKRSKTVRGSLAYELSDGSTIPANRAKQV